MTSVKARYNNGFKYCCILYVNNNTQYIVNYIASFILIHKNRKISLFSQIFKAVATIRGTGKV